MPGKFIGIGLNYSDHAAETGAKPPTEPIVFMKARRDTCMVPKCRQLKEQLRALAQQQAQMDERRRAAMNAAYR